MVLVIGFLSTAITLSLSGKIPVWMKVDPSIQRTASIYFFILYTPMLFRTSSIIFGTVLRASGDAKTPMRVGLFVNLINVILNFLLIYPTRDFGPIIIPGAGLGVVGAALASSISFVFGGIYMAIAVVRHKKISPKGESIKPDWNVLAPCLRVAGPNMMQRFGTSLGYVVFASMINSLGGIATAAHTIANTVESAFYIPGYGMQSAAATLAGNAYGAKDKDKMKELARIFIPIEIALMTISGALLFVLSEPLVSIFSDNAEVIRLGSTVLKMVAVSEPFYGFSIIVEGFMQGVGKTKLPFVFNIAGMWGIRILGTFICTQILSMTLVSAWGAMIAHNMLLFLLFMIVYIKGLWNPLQS
jgi:putative MATE family efflux protein